MSLKITGSYNENVLHIHTLLSQESRGAVDVVIGIDISGSMDGEANVGGEGQGVSLLQVAIHTAKTIIKSTSELDRIGLVLWDDKVTTSDIFPISAMDENGKRESFSFLEDRKPRCQTNLWGGIEASVNCLLDGTDGVQNRTRHVIILTDGLPNVEPAKPYDVKWKGLCESKNLHNIHLHTLGLGNRLKSNILSNLAHISNGTFAFIPDAGMMTQVFCSTMSKILTTIGTDVSFSVEGTNLNPQFCPYPYQQTGDKLVVMRPGSIRINQDMDLAIDFGHNAMVTDVMFRCNFLGQDIQYKINLELDHQSKPDTLYHLHRNTAAYLFKSWAQGESPTESLPKLKEEVSSGQEGDTSILSDLNGEVTLSFNNFSSDDWGRHYLLSLADAYKNQHRNNFKDFGVQLFCKCEIFNKIYDDMEKIYQSIPPPKGKPKYNHSTGQMVSMSLNTAELSQRGGVPCVIDSTSIRMEDDTTKRADAIEVGDVLFGGGKVRYILQTHTQDEPIIKIENLSITPYHPIKLSNQNWAFPNDIEGGSNENTNSDVFSFVLTDNFYFKVDQIDVICLGHGMMDNDILAHPFFGDKIVSHIREIVGQDSGKIVFKSGAMITDKTSGIINDLDREKVESIT